MFYDHWCLKEPFTDPMNKPRMSILFGIWQQQDLGGPQDAKSERTTKSCHLVEAMSILTGKEPELATP